SSGSGPTRSSIACNRNAGCAFRLPRPERPGPSFQGIAYDPPPRASTPADFCCAGSQAAISMKRILRDNAAYLDRRTLLRGAAALAAGGMVGIRQPRAQGAAAPAALSAQTLNATEQVIARYEAIARHGGW